MRTALTRAVEEARVKYNLTENEVWCDEEERMVFVNINGFQPKGFHPYTAKREIAKWISQSIKRAQEMEIERRSLRML